MFIMLARFNQSNLRSLFLNIVLFIGLASAMNGLIFGLGWDAPSLSQSKAWFDPPEYVFGLVWTVLFGLMATARWILNDASIESSRQAQRWVTGLIGFCLLHPLYTLAFHSSISVLIGNLATMALASFVIVKVWPISQVASALISPVALWLAIATVIILSRLGWM
jgi:translocator protein